ncbi:hypothetical protein LJB86_05565 [Deltaproteobacteria bacterium OttesenSCG-928-M10]|nr:hypothetical protein [Deltaproteobacteria bacterium OttesenSCG-928-M10]
MAEVKRRNKSPETGEDKGGEKPPRRQTRVTLTQDVSSKYRKIMPKGPAKPRTRQPADGSAPPAGRGRKIDGGDDYSPRRSGPARERSSRDESPRRTAGGRSQTAPRRTGGSGPGRGDAPRRSGPDRTGAPSSRAGAPKKDGQLELRVILDRELPEAAKQVAETQALILNAANDLFSLVESLEQGHAFCAQCLSDLTSDGTDPIEVVRSLNVRLDEALKIITALYEKMSFQDLAGQRLARVETFLSALSTVLKPLTGGPARRQDWAAGFRKEGGPTRQASSRDKRTPEPASKKADNDEKNNLKGPQAPGEGVDQAEIDRLMANL